MRTTELFEMIKEIGKKQLREKKKISSKKEPKAKGKPDPIIINPPLNTIDQRR